MKGGTTVVNGLFKLLEDNKVELSEEAKKGISDAFYAAQQEKDVEINKLKSVLKEAKEAIKSLRTGKADEIKEHLDGFETKMIEKMSRFLEAELSEMVPQTLIESVAKVEVLEPLVESIKESFAKNGIKVDSKGHDLLKKAKKEINELQSQVNKATKKRYELEEVAEKLLGKYLLKERCAGLLPEQATKVMKIFKNATYDEIKEKFDNVRDLVIGESKESGKRKEDKKGDSTSARLKVLQEKKEKEVEKGNTAILGTQYL